MSECRSPGCVSPRTGSGSGRFCAWHSDLFTKLRAELDEGKAERKRSAGIKRGKRRPKCETFECNEIAKPGQTICIRCLRHSGAA